MTKSNHPLEEINFDPVFTEAREGWRKIRAGIWIIPQDAKESLEESIARSQITEPPYIPEEETDPPEPSSILSESITVVNDGSISCQNAIQTNTDTFFENEWKTKG